MGIVFRQSAKAAVVTFIGATLGVLSLYVSQKILPQQSFGFIRNLTIQAVVAGSVLVAGFHSTLGYYIHKFPPGTSQRRALLGFCFFLPVLLVTGATLLYGIRQDWILGLFQSEDQPMIEQYFWWLPVFILLFLFHTLLESHLYSLMFVAKASFIREIVVRLIGFAFIIAYGLNMISFDWLVAGTVLPYAAAVIWLWILAMRQPGFGISFNWRVFSGAQIRDILDFTGFHALMLITASAMGYIDALMLAPLSESGLKASAVYSFATLAISFMYIPQKSMMAAIIPGMTKAFQTSDIPKTKEIFHRSTTNMFLATAGMTLLICCNLPNVVGLLEASYESVLPLTLILALGRLVDSLTGPSDYVLSVSRLYRFGFALGLGLTIAMCAFNAYLIPRYGFYGAAVATTSTLIIYNIGKALFLSRRLDLRPPLIPSLKILGCLALATGANFLIPYWENPIWDGLFRSPLVLGVFVLGLMFFKPSSDVPDAIRGIIARLPFWRRRK